MTKDSFILNFVVNLSRSVRAFGRAVAEGRLAHLIERRRYGRLNWYDAVHALPTYFPSSANYMRYPHLTVLAAERSVKALSLLAGDIQGNEASRLVEAQQFLAAEESNSEALAKLLCSYESDKATEHHNYHLVYSKIFSRLLKLKRPLSVVEIGIGTNNPDLVSSMGRGGKPGASLRAFRDFLPAGTKVSGGDCDRDILFQENGISTAFVDQLEPESFEDFWRDVKGDKIDFFIDDGLHAPLANLNSLRFALKHLSAGGWVVIEDIPARSLAVWNVVSAFFSKAPQYECWIVRCLSANLFVVHKKS